MTNRGTDLIRRRARETICDLGLNLRVRDVTAGGKHFRVAIENARGQVEVLTISKSPRAEFGKVKTLNQLRRLAGRALGTA